MYLLEIVDTCGIEILFSQKIVLFICLFSAVYILMSFDWRGPYRLKSSDCFMKVQTTDKRSEAGLSM
jgi:hypothetical protein